MDNIKKQIAWLRAQHDKLALSENTITGYSEAADTMEKLLAVYEAAKSMRESSRFETKAEAQRLLYKAVLSIDQTRREQDGTNHE